MKDPNKAKTERMMVKRTLKNLELNRMAACYVETKEDALKLVRQIIPDGVKTASGGSQTLVQCGIIDFLKEHTKYFDRYDKTLSPEGRKQNEREAYFADFYLTSANALTEHGEIYQVDGASNRISALAYGPDKVIIVAGINKIVPNLRAAVERVKRHAAPANAIRLASGRFCENTGICISPCFDENDLMCHADCGDDTICCNTLIMKKQRIKDRITVIIVGEELGY